MNPTKLLCFPAITMVALMMFSFPVVGGQAVRASFVTNGDFELLFVPDGTDDSIPTGWMKFESRPEEDSTINASDSNGPSAGGIQSLSWSRSGGASGDWSAVEQNLLINASQYASLTLSLDTMVIDHNLEAGGFVDPAFEWPTFVLIQYKRASDCQTQIWQHGWYLDPPGDSISGPVDDPGRGIIDFFDDTLIGQSGTWVANSFDLFDELPDLGAITNIRVGGSGWSFEGRADNVQITGTPISVSLLTNGDFEAPFVPDGTGDSIPTGWTKFESRPEENSTINASNSNGPSAAGVQSLSWSRSGGLDGDWTAVEQGLSIDASEFESLTLSLDTMVIDHNLEAGGFSDPAFEWPVFVLIKYDRASDGVNQIWQHGWYLDPPGDSISGPVDDPGRGIIDFFDDTLIEESGVWVENSFDLFDELPDLGTITNIRVGGSGWSFEGRADNVQITGIPSPPTLPNCDLDGDGICDIDDIDMLIMNIAAGTRDPLFDLNGDDCVDLDDRDEWLAQAGAMNLPSGNPYLVGDVDLDGAVDVSDFNTYNNNKFTETGKWSQADFNASGFTDVSDFNQWNANKFQSSSNTSMIPEPSCVALVLWGVLAVCIRRTTS